MKKPLRKQVEPPIVDEPPEIVEETPAPTLGDLLGHMLGDAEPVLPGFEMDDEPLPTPLGRSYIEATNSRAAAQERGNQRAATQDIYGNPMERNDDVAGGDVQPGTGDVSEVSPGPDAPAQPSAGSGPILEGEIIASSKPGGAVRYESRIRILDAWQYRGAVATAPAYVDRNWIGYASDYDALRQIDPGPCLRVPLTSDPQERVVTICRVGDYVVHEEIVGDDGRLSEKIEVWEQGQFQKLFLPKQMAGSI
jgi:hypothetical protein